MFIFCVENTNWYIKIMFGIASIFYISKFVQGVELVFDLIIGSKEKNTIFLGVYNVECLDVFHKVSYTNIYFDDDIMKKNYMVFDDVFHEDICQGDRVLVQYFKYSRIVIRIEKSG